MEFNNNSQIEPIYWEALSNYLKTSPVENINYFRFSESLIGSFSFNTSKEQSNNLEITTYVTNIGNNVGYKALLNKPITIAWNVNQDYRVGCFYPDFFISFHHFLYVIEIDGFSCHEASKEKATLDKQRERMILKYGYIPIRFSAQEVLSDPINCVKETLQIVLSYPLEISTKYNRQDKEAL